MVLPGVKGTMARIGFFRGEARTQQRRASPASPRQFQESAAASRHHESCMIRGSLDFVANFFWQR